MFVGSSGVDWLFSTGAASQVGVVSEVMKREMMVRDAGRSASMFWVFSASFEGRWSLIVMHAV